LNSLITRFAKTHQFLKQLFPSVSKQLRDLGYFDATIAIKNQGL